MHKEFELLNFESLTIYAIYAKGIHRRNNEQYLMTTKKYNLLHCVY